MVHGLTTDIHIMQTERVVRHDEPLGSIDPEMEAPILKCRKTVEGVRDIEDQLFKLYFRNLYLKIDQKDPDTTAITHRFKSERLKQEELEELFAGHKEFFDAHSQMDSGNIETLELR
ncbi:hypothetical protein FSARC_15012 [Fusarium sarcochroum]|uniref:Uncharacterized protein n=1 Tax=Fusarium sarcochroum TaxID=1208366 RepID=A0A8H4SPK5_9HYPO|nr:hypothetical protein FSARC_15012 [Fusarium sarcochroum]